MIWPRVSVYKAFLLTCLFCILLVLAGYAVLWKWAYGINELRPSRLQVAKIVQLVGLEKGDDLRVERFQLRYTGFHDTLGSCGFRITVNSDKVEDVLKSWSVSDDADIMKTNVFLIDWLNKKELWGGAGRYYTTTTECVRSYQVGERWMVWKGSQHCVAFWDRESTNTLVVSTEGDMFLPDAVFK